jgi:hypothetical protein
VRCKVFDLYEKMVLMNTLAKYIADIVEPTFTDFEQDKTPRRAFIAAVVAYHSIDRAAKDLGKRTPGNIRKDWCKASMAFNLVDVAAHQYKHVSNHAAKQRPTQWLGLLSLGEVLSRTTVTDFTYIMRETIEFLRAQADQAETKG